MTVLYWLLCVLIGIIPAFLLFRKDRNRKIPVKWLPSLLRFLTFFLTAVLLLAPAFPRHQKIEEKPIVFWLQDESSSMKNALGADSRIFRKKAEALLNGQNLPFQIIPKSFGTTLTNGISFKYHQPGTNLSNALQAIEDRYQNQNIGAVIIVSDGNYNLGSNPLYAIPEHNLPIYAVALGDSTTPRDAYISFLRANKTVTQGNQFELIVTLKAQKLAGRSGKVKVTHHGHSVAEEPFSINASGYSHTFRFYISAKQKGLQKYTVVIPHLSGDDNSSNNKKTFFVKVLDKTVHILIAAAAPHPDIAAIKEALRHHPEYKITVRYRDKIPQAVSDVDLLITHGLPNRNGLNIPKHGKTPTWYILGPHINLRRLSKEQHLLTIQPKSGVLNVLPKLNSDFNLFALPKNIRAVTDKMPPLKTPNGQYTVKSGKVLFWQNKTKAPLWLLNTGRYPEAALIGTGLWRWRTYSYRYFQKAKTVDNLIQQTVTFLTHQYQKKPLEIALEKYSYSNHESIIINGFLHNSIGELVNSPIAKLTIRDSIGKTKRLVFNKSGKSYQANIGELTAGRYTVVATAKFGGKVLKDSARFRVSKTSLEALKTNANYSVLYQMAHKSEGHFYTLGNMQQLLTDLKNNPGIKPVIHQETQYLNWIDWKWLFLIILIIASGEWLLRKYWGL